MINEQDINKTLSRSPSTKENSPRINLSRNLSLKDLKAADTIIKHAPTLTQALGNWGSWSSSASTDTIATLSESDLSRFLEQRATRHMAVQPLVEHLVDRQAQIEHKQKMSKITQPSAIVGEKTKNIEAIKNISMAHEGSLAYVSNGEDTTVESFSFMMNGKKIITKKALGNGLNGTVYLASDESGQDIIIKALTAKIDLKLLKRALYENANIHKAGLKSEILFDPKTQQLFLTMPKFAGVTAKKAITELREEILVAQADGDTHKALDLLNNMFQILYAVLEAADKFHNKSLLVHGDAWLDNYMVDLKDGQYVVNLIDYGACCMRGMTAKEYMQYFQFEELPPGGYFVPPEIPCSATVEQQKANERLIQEYAERMPTLNAQLAEIEKDLTVNVQSPPLLKRQQSKRNALVKVTTDHAWLNSMMNESGPITVKSDLYEIMASFVFEGMLELIQTWSIDKTSLEAENMQEVLLEFMHWSTLHCCNADLFLAYIGSSDVSREFFNQVRRERNEEMQEKGFTTSAQCRVELPEAMRQVKKIIEKVKHLQKMSMHQKRG